MRQKFPRPVRGFAVIFHQTLFRQAEDALGSPRINVALAEDDPPAAPFKWNLAVLHTPLDIGIGQVQIPGNFFKIEQLIWHESPASTGLRFHGPVNASYNIPRVNGHAVKTINPYGTTDENETTTDSDHGFLAAEPQPSFDANSLIETYGSTAKPGSKRIFYPNRYRYPWT